MAARRAVSRCGAARQRMRRRLRSTAEAASRRGSMEGPRSATLGPTLPRAFGSQPSAAGAPSAPHPAQNLKGRLKMLCST